MRQPAQRRAAATLVATDVPQLDPGGEAAAQVGEHLVAVADPVHQASLQCLGAGDGSRPDQLPRTLLRDAPRGGQSPDELLDQRFDQGSHGLPVGVGESLLEKCVRGVLELVPLTDLGLHPSPIQGFPQEQRVDVQPGQHDVARGLQPDRVEGGGDVVGQRPGGELPEGLGVGHRGLAAAAAEGEHGVADVLGGGEPHRRAEPGDQPVHVGVHRTSGESLLQHPQARPAT